MVTLSALVVGSAALSAVLAVVLAERTPPRDLETARLGAWTGVASLVLITAIPLAGSLVGSNVEAGTSGIVPILLFVPSVLYGLAGIALPVATFAAAQGVATDQRSWRGALAFGTPAIAGAAWWLTLYAWRFLGTLPALPGPLGALGSPAGVGLTLLDLATLPTLVVALVYAAVRDST